MGQIHIEGDPPVVVRVHGMEIVVEHHLDLVPAGPERRSFVREVSGHPDLCVSGTVYGEDKEVLLRGLLAPCPAFSMSVERPGLSVSGLFLVESVQEDIRLAGGAFFKLRATGPFEFVLPHDRS